MNRTEAFNRALNHISKPENYDQAVQIYQSLGEPIALMLAVPLVMLILMGAVAQDQYGNTLWDHKGYWVVVFFVMISMGIMVVAFPYLVMQL